MRSYIRRVVLGTSFISLGNETVEVIDEKKEKILQEPSSRFFGARTASNAMYQLHALEGNPSLQDFYGKQIVVGVDTDILTRKMKHASPFEYALQTSLPSDIIHLAHVVQPGDDKLQYASIMSGLLQRCVKSRRYCLPVMLRVNEPYSNPTEEIAQELVHFSTKVKADALITGCVHENLDQVPHKCVASNIIHGNPPTKNLETVIVSSEQTGIATHFTRDRKKEPMEKESQHSGDDQNNKQIMLQHEASVWARVFPS